MAGLGTLRRLQGVAERGRCWASYPVLLLTVGRWYAWLQVSVEALVGTPQLKPVDVVVDGGAAADGGGRCLSGG